MGCFGVRAFDSDDGMDAIDTLRASLPPAGIAFELKAAIRTLLDTPDMVPDANKGLMHAGPVALTELLIRYKDGSVDVLDSDDEEPIKFAAVEALIVDHRSVSWMHDYLSNILRVRVEYADRQEKESGDDRTSWGGWREKSDWLLWQKHMAKLMGFLDTLILKAKDGPFDLLEAEIDEPEDEEPALICATCGMAIENDYYRVLDNFLQVKYFDCQDGSDNLFCSPECIMKALSVEQFYVNENDDDYRRRSNRE